MWCLTGERFDYLARIIDRVVVHHDNLVPLPIRKAGEGTGTNPGPVVRSLRQGSCGRVGGSLGVALCGIVYLRRGESLVVW